MTSDAEIVHARNCAMRLIEGPAPCTCRLVERKQAQTIKRLSARVEELERGLREAIDGWAEGAAYKGEYLRKKHGDDEGIAKARSLLTPSKNKE